MFQSLTGYFVHSVAKQDFENDTIKHFGLPSPARSSGREKKGELARP